MLVLVNLFVFEVVEALVLRVATHEREGGFTQVVFQEAVAGLDEAGILGFKHTGFVFVPNETGIFGKSGLSLKAVDVADFGDDTGGEDGADTRDGE